MAFQLVAGHDNAGTLADMSPQPRSPGLMYPRITRSASGKVYRDGSARTVWQWGFMSRTQWAAFLTQAGATLADKSVEVTVRTITNNMTTFANYNAELVLPEMGDGLTNETGMFVNIEVEITSMVAL